jgi:hypothetical protein
MEHAKRFPRKVGAQQRLDVVTAGVVTGMYVDPGPGALPSIIDLGGVTERMIEWRGGRRGD